VIDAIEAAASTLEDTEWTADGRDDAADAVDAFVEEASESVAVDAFPEHDDLDELIAALDAVAEAVADADLDPDADAETIAALIDATDGLEAGLDDAEEWDDLETHEQLRAQGGTTTCSATTRDFPVEWSALKEHEARGNVDMILLALNSLESDFMERHCLEAFERMGKRGKTEASWRSFSAARKRDQFAIRILGKMAAEEATETLVEFVSEDSNPQLQKIVFKARRDRRRGGGPAARGPARSRGGHRGPRAPPRRPCARTHWRHPRDRPLADALAEDDSDDVRAAAGWALRQIGTREAIETVAEYADEHSFIVSTGGREGRAVPRRGVGDRLTPTAVRPTILII